MPQIQDLPPAITLDGTEAVPVIVNPDSDPVAMRATTAQIAALGSAGGVVATLTGSGGGTAKVVQRANSTGYKAYAIMLSGWKDSGQTYNWPVAFATMASAVEDMAPGSTVTTAHIVFGDSTALSPQTGVITVKGY